MLKKIEHVGILVSDMDRSITFYTTILGLELRARMRLNEQTELAFLRIGDGEIELIHQAGEPEQRADGVVEHFAFTVTDVAAVLAHLKKHNVTLLNQEPWELPAIGCRVAFFRGPDGEKLELFAKL